MKTLVAFLLTVLALPVAASTTILSGVLFEEDTGFIGGYGPGQGTFSLSLESTTLTYVVSSAGSPDIGIAAPALTLALTSGDMPLSFASRVLEFQKSLMLGQVFDGNQAPMPRI